MQAMLSVRLETKRAAELAIEHVMQRNVVQHDAISAFAMGDRNTAGSRPAGSDRADARPASRDRDDAPLEGAVALRVIEKEADTREVQRILAEAGAQEI